MSGRHGERPSEQNGEHRDRDPTIDRTGGRHRRERRIRRLRIPDGRGRVMTLDIRGFVDRLGCAYDDPLMIDLDFKDEKEEDIRTMV